VPLAASDDDNSRKNFQSFLKSLCNARDNYSMAVRSDPFESAKSHFFDTSSWGAFCDVTLTSHEEVQVKGVVLGLHPQVSSMCSVSKV